MEYPTLRALAAAGILLAFSGGPPPQNELDGPELYRLTLRSTVLIVTPAQGKGTGWLLDRDKRLVVTNYHVVGDHDAVDVLFPTYAKGEVVSARAHYTENRRRLEEAGRLVRGRVVHKERDCDLALLELPALPDDVRVLPLAAASPRPGDAVHSIGNRSDLEVLWVCTSGSVRQVFRSHEGYFWRGWHLGKGAMVIVTQSPINDGDSGGPLVNERGELVGVLSAVKWQAQLASVGIDVSELRAFLARARQEVPRPERPPSPASDRPLGGEVYQRTIRFVAWVKLGSASNRATGWLLDRDRKLLVTTCQAVGSQDAVEVVFPVSHDGRVVAEHRFYSDNQRLLQERGHSVRGRVLARSARRDLALLELDSVPDSVGEARLADSSPRPGERVHTVGNPNGVEALWVYASGVVRQLGHAGLGQTEDRPDPAVVLAQLPSSSNDRGGPLVNDAGRLVGVVTGKEAPQQLVSYCLDVSEVRAFVAEARPRWEPHTAADYRARGALYARSGWYDWALADYTSALKLDPSNAVLYSERAQFHTRRGDAERALADCNEALRLDPRLPSAYGQRAAAHNCKNEPDRALADCDAALKLDPKCAAAFSQRGEARRLRGELERAVADCDEAIWLDQRLAAAYRCRGQALAAQGELDRALADLARAVELGPFDAAGHRARGDVHRRKNDADKALEDYTRAIEVNPRDALARLGRGLAFGMKDRHDPAIADFTQALRLDDQSARAHAGRGTSWMRKDDLNRALADYAAALRLQPQLAGEVLQEVQRRAAELSAGEGSDAARCAELCRRVLLTFQPLFGRNADVQSAIKDGLAAAERQPDIRERAQLLRAVIGEVRLRLESPGSP